MSISFYVGQGVGLLGLSHFQVQAIASPRLQISQKGRPETQEGNFDPLRITSSDFFLHELDEYLSLRHKFAEGRDYARDDPIVWSAEDVLLEKNED